MSSTTDTIELNMFPQQPWWPKSMVRATWLQHRATLIGLLVLFVACAATIILGAFGLHSMYAKYLAAGCTGRPIAIVTCANTANYVASNNDSFTVLITVLRALPVVVGLFVGAPLLSRDLESGTFRFAWTQSVGRVRYVFSSLLILAVVVVVIAAVLGLLLGGWYAHDLNVMNPNLENQWQPGSFCTTWFMLAAWTLCALSLGALMGAIVKRVVASMLLATLIVGGLAVASSLYLDRLLRIGSLVTSRIPIAGVNTGTLDRVRQGHPLIWLLRGWMTGPKGHVLGAQAVSYIENRAFATKNPSRWLSLHHDTFWVGYQTASRFWIYQGVVGGILIALAVACGLVTLRVVRAGRA
jgi:hypothetical protein